MNLLLNNKMENLFTDNKGKPLSEGSFYQIDGGGKYLFKPISIQNPKAYFTPVSSEEGEGEFLLTKEEVSQRVSPLEELSLSQS